MDWEFLEKTYDSTRMRENILSQGISIKQTIQKEKKKIMELADELKVCKRFVFSGCGDKYLIPLITEFLWNHISDKPLKVMHSRLLANYPPKFLDEETCIVLLSQSGTTVDVIDAFKEISKRKCHIVSITNLKEKKENSLIALSENYDKAHVINTHTKLYPEEPLPSTGTFHTSLATLNLFTIFLNHPEKSFLEFQEKIIPNIVDKLSTSKEVIEESKNFAEKFKEEDNFYVLGDGPRYGVARKHARIMLMEGVKTNACDIESEEFEHSLIATLEGRKKNPLITLKPLNSWKSANKISNIEQLWMNHAGKEKVYSMEPFKFLDKNTKNNFSKIEGDIFSPFLYAVLSEWQCYYLALARKTDPGKAAIVKKIRDEKGIKKLFIKS